MTMQFNLISFITFLLILGIEIFIGIYIDDSFIRPFFGDFLVIFLLYYLVRSFIKIRSSHLIIFVVLFAYGVEIAQYFNIADLLHIKNKVLRVIVGTTFSWEDISAYTLAGVVLYLIPNRYK